MKSFEELTYEYYQVCEQIQAAQEAKVKLEEEILAHHTVGMSDWKNSIDTGTSNFDINEHAKLRIVRSNKVTVNADTARSLGIDCWRTKLELDKRKFDALSDDNKALASDAITIEPGKPSLKIILK